MTIRESYLTAAGAAAELIRDPAVTAAWSRPSALAKMSVGALANHLARQIDLLPGILAVEATEAPIPLLAHYARVQWLNADLDNETNTGIREGSEERAGAGPAGLADQVTVALATLSEVLPTAPDDKRVLIPWGPWTLRLDDFLTTRLMELAVHSDDLAYSVEVPTPELPPAVLDPVFALLTRLAVRRHGAVAVLRGLSRSERAPGDITAL